MGPVVSTITYRHRGGEQVVEADDGESVMRAAVRAGVPGIIGQCGGQAVCATCHVRVEAGDTDGLPAPDEDEDDTLEGVDDRHERSRLGCQLIAGDHFESLTVTVATGG